MTSDNASPQPQSLRDLAAEDRNALFNRVIADISVHGKVRQALAENKLNPREFYARLNADPEALKRYARAKSDGLEAIANDTLAIADDDDLDPNDKRVRIDTRKWLLSKLVPKVYGDRLDVEHGGNINVTVKRFSTKDSDGDA